MDASDSQPQLSSGKSSGHGGKRKGAGRRPKDAELIATIRNALGAFPSADPYQPQRTYIYCPLVEANREHDECTRLEIARKALALYNANGAAVRAVDFTARAAIGVGMFPRPKTSSKKFNEEVKERFVQGPGSDRRFFDAARQLDAIEAQDLIARQVFLQGDFFWHKMRAGDGTSRVRFVEGVNVGNVSRATSARFQQEQWTDGARLDALGGVTQWRVLNRPMGDAYTDMLESDLLQVKRMRRAGGVRGVSWLAVPANHVHDLMDIVAFAKQSHKNAAQFPFWISSPRNGFSMAENIQLGAADATSGQVTKTHQMRRESGVPVLEPGETVNPMPNDFPGETFFPFLKECRREIAEGFGAPYEVLYDITSAGGANNRSVLVDLQLVLDEVQWMIATKFLRPWYQDWVWHEWEAGYLKEMPDDWWKVGFSTPAKLSVDNGRDGKLTLEQIARRFVSEDYARGLLGIDGMEQDEEILEIAQRRRELVEGTGLTVEEVFGNPDKVPASAMAQPEPGTPPGQ